VPFNLESPYDDWRREHGPGNPKSTTGYGDNKEWLIEKSSRVDNYRELTDTYSKVPTFCGDFLKWRDTEKDQPTYFENFRSRSYDHHYNDKATLESHTRSLEIARDYEIGCNSRSADSIRQMDDSTREREREIHAQARKEDHQHFLDQKKSEENEERKRKGSFLDMLTSKFGKH
jgi:hypothetical protein